MVPSTIRFQIMSDLHLETHPSYDYDFPQTAPYLALLGDIGHVAKDDLFKFLKRQLYRYRVAFYLFGNHEPWHLSMKTAKKKMNRFVTQMKRLRESRSIGEFVFLDQESFDLDEKVTVLGCTLFSKILPEQAAAVSSRLIDFRDILDWDVSEHVDAHLEDLQWLNDKVVELSRAGRKIIIFTHYSPCVDERANNARYKHSEVTSGFVTDLAHEECWTNEAVVLWAFGHTHFNCDFVDDHRKRVVANQKGYYLFPQHSFQASKVFEVAPAVETGSTQNEVNLNEKLETKARSS